MHPLTSHADLLRLCGDDPWVRWAVPDPLPGQVWVHQGIVLVHRRGPRTGFWVAPCHPTTTTARGPCAPNAPTAGPGDEGTMGTAGIAAALHELREGGHLERVRARTISVPQAHAAVAHEVLDLEPGRDWEWMWTSVMPPANPREQHLITLDDREDADLLRGFTRQHNPRVWTEIGTGRVRRWMGLRDESGALIAIGGVEREATGVPHLAGIVTAQDHRRRGGATVLSGALTRWALSRYPVCTLGVFSDNDAARRLYTGLGFRTARAWHSCSVRSPVGA